MTQTALPAVLHSRGTADEATAPLIMSTTIAILVIWKLFIPLLILIAAIDWLTSSADRRILILRRTGLSQQQIADRLHITRYRVRQTLAS